MRRQELVVDVGGWGRGGGGETWSRKRSRSSPSQVYLEVPRDPEGKVLDCGRTLSPPFEEPSKNKVLVVVRPTRV